MFRALCRWRAAFVIATLLVAACGQPALVGTDLGATPAPDFALSDQTGQTVSLASLRGKAIALTFLYSTCPDVCPAITAKLRQAQDSLGSEAERVAIVVVSVDPEGDTMAQVQRYTADAGMEGRWHYLIGDRATLGRVWAAYGVAVFPGPGGMIAHTDAVYLIDRQGRRRVLMRHDLNPTDLAANLRALARA